MQLLSNGIDKGEVYAFSEAQIFNYSYKKTAISFFSISRFMLRHALLNFLAKSPIHQRFAESRPSIERRLRAPTNEASTVGIAAEPANASFGRF